MYLVQRICEDEEFQTLMTADELIHYVDFQDIVSEKYKIWDVSVFGKVSPIRYVGWQPGCLDTGSLIEFVNEDGEVVISGYGIDH